MPITVNAYVLDPFDPSDGAVAAAAGELVAPATATAAPVAAEAPMNVLRSNAIAISPCEACYEA
ncbi:hypothetical protein ACFW6V_19990 [Streptomyces sp. NPDC058734]|uniref:hypothetical protein n=1 Tax=Streptomyces sp. NPDC058734 TaxID=3346615 RepID=UPI00368A4BDF